MTSFGWKRKVGDKICESTRTNFESQSKDDDITELESGEVDWLTLHPKRKCLQLEDGKAKGRRLKHDGSTLATAERYWEALQKWDEALLYTPNDETLFDMKAQAYLCVGELYPAVSMATKAVEQRPNWWEAHQTLGRTNLHIGEVKMALKSFQRAVHMNPADEQLWTDDLRWSLSLLHQKERTQQCGDTEPHVEIVEPNSDVNADESEHGKRGQLGTDLLHMSSVINTRHSVVPSLSSVPQNYVYMRD